MRKTQKLVPYLFVLMAIKLIGPYPIIDFFSMDTKTYHGTYQTYKFLPSTSMLPYLTDPSWLREKDAATLDIQENINKNVIENELVGLPNHYSISLIS